MKQIVTFYVLACTISWVIWMPLYLPHFGIGELPVLPYHHALGGLGPLMAAIVMNFWVEGKEGIRKIGRGLTDFKRPQWLLIAFTGPFVLLLLSLLIQYIAKGEGFDILLIGKTGEYPEFSFASYFLFNLVFFGFGEESGWRGFMFPQLQSRYHILVACFVFTLFWAAWHIPTFLYRPNYASMGLAGIIGWFFSLFTGSILLAWLYNRSKGSILVCAVFHAAIDIAFVSDVVTKEVSSYLGMLITIWGLIVAVSMLIKSKGTKEKVVLTESTAPAALSKF